jgi:hypothetical protein
MLSAGAMARHEKYCKMNPSNKHRCFDYCEHLKREVENIQDEGEPPVHITHFTCAIHGWKMYSYKFEKYDPTYIKGLIRMPLECKEYNGPIDGIDIDPEIEKLLSDGPDKGQDRFKDFDW